MRAPSAISGVALPNWGCADDCGRLGFGYPTAVALARDVVVPNVAAIGSGVSSFALASMLLMQMQLSCVVRRRGEGGARVRVAWGRERIAAGTRVALMTCGATSWAWVRRVDGLLRAM